MSASLVGELALWVALLLAAWGTILSAIAGPLRRADLARSGERAAHAATLFITLATIALWSALLRADLSLQYVAMRGGIAARPIERVIALWSAPAGALLILGLATGVVTSGALVLARRARGQKSTTESPTTLAPAAALAQLTLAAMLITMLLGARPFEVTRWPVADGAGLPPAWRHIAMLLVWPIWAGGVGAAAAACSLAVAAAAAPERSRAGEAAGTAGSGTSIVWREARRWAGAAWLLAGAALLLGLWWAYRTMPVVSGWAGRALDAGTVVAWGLLAAASSRRMRRLASVSARLLALALPLPVLLATSLTRPDDGWDPLHLLAHDRGAVWWVVGVAAIAQVLLFAAIRVRGRRLASAAVLPAPVATLGVRLVMVGALLVLVGLVASALRRDASLVTAPGAASTTTDVLGREWRIAYQGLSVRETRDEFGAPRSREVLHPFAMQMGDEEWLVIARLREFVDVLGRPTAAPRLFPGIRHGLLQDVVALPDSVGADDTAHVLVSFVPLPGLIWLGGLVLLVGGALAMRVNRSTRA